MAHWNWQQFLVTYGKVYFEWSFVSWISKLLLGHCRELLISTECIEILLLLVNIWYVWCFLTNSFSQIVFFQVLPCLNSHETKAFSEKSHIYENQLNKWMACHCYELKKFQWKLFLCILMSFKAPKKLGQDWYINY